MSRSLMSWSRVWRDPWLYLLMLLCLGCVLLAYRQSVPVEVDLAAGLRPVLLEGFDATDRSSSFPPPATAISLTLLTGLVYACARRLAADWLAAIGAAGVVIGAATVGLLLARPWITPISNRLVLLFSVTAMGTELVLGAGDLSPERRLYYRIAMILLAAFGLRLGIAHWSPDPDPLIPMKLAAKDMLTHGVGAAPETNPAMAPMPPVLRYEVALVGHAYRALVSPSLDLGSQRLSLALRMPGMLLDMLTIAVVMAYAARHRGARVALWAGGLYGLNPGIIYVVARSAWLADPIYAFLIASSVAALVSQRAGVLGTSTALAILTQPQAAAFFPFLTASGFRNLRGNRPLRAIAFGVGVSVLVVVPFLITGEFADTMRAMSDAAGDAPNATSTVFNIWWWGRLGRGEAVDRDILVGPLSYRAMGLILFFGAANALIIWKAWWVQRRGDLTLLAAFVGMAFFMLPTDTRVDALFPTFALLALAAAHDGRAWVLAGMASITWSVNLISSDADLLGSLSAIWPGLASAQAPIQTAMALVNTSVLLLWSYALLRMGRPADAMRLKRGIR